MKLTNNKGYSISHLLESPLVIILVVAVVYAVVAKLSFWVKITPGDIAPIFPSAGIAIAAVLIYRWPALLGIFLGSFLYNIIMSDNGPFALMINLFIGLGATTGAGAGAYLVRRFCNNEHPMSSGKDVLILIIIGAICCCAINSTVGVLSLSLGGLIPWRLFDYAWLTWWVGDVSGVIVAAPFILAWNLKTPSHKNLEYKIEAILMGITTLVFCYYVFFQHTPMEYCLSIALLYAAFRFGFRGVSTLALLIAILASIGTSIGTSVFTGDSTNITLIHLTAFLSVSITSALFLAGLMTEHKRAEEALKQTQQLLANTFASLHDAIFILNADKAQIMDCNPGASDVFGYEREEMLGRTTEFLHVDEAALKEFRGHLHRAMESQGSLRSFGYRMKRKDRTVFPTEHSVTPLKDEYGETLGWVSLVRDITERKQAEQALNESEARYRTLFEDATDGMALADADTGELIDCNLGLCQMVERDKAELVGQMQSILHPPTANHEQFSLTFQQHRDLNPGIALEDCLLSKSGKLITVEIRAARIVINGHDLILGTFRDITERKKNSLALKESEEKYGHIVENAPIGIFKRDLEGKFHYINQRLVLQLECKTEEEFRKNYGLISQRWVHPEKHDEFKELILKNRRVYDYQIESKLISGATRWFSIYAFLDDSNTFINGFSLDITERKRAEEALRGSETKLQAIFDTVGAGIFIIDKDTQIIIEANPTAVEMTGLPRESIIGQICHSLVCPAQAGKCPVKDLGQDVDHSERKLLCGEGHSKDILKTVHPITIKGRDCYVESFIDITERKDAEEKLRLQEMQFRTIIESTGDGILAVDNAGMVIKTNQKFAELWQIPSDLLNKDTDKALLMHILSQLVDPDTFLEKVHTLYASTTVGFDTISFKDGRIMERYSYPILSEGVINGRVWSFRDITERKRAEEEKAKLENQLLQAQKMEAIGTLAGGISHDFNNILGAVIGYTEMAMTEDQKEICQEDLQEVLKGAERAKNLVKQILTFSRQDDHEKKPLDIKILLKEAVKFLRASIPTTIEIHQNVKEEYCNIIADPTQMHQVIMNLCTNATHAMKNAVGTLKIELANIKLTKDEIPNYPDLKPGPYVKLTVSDTGHGIEPAHIQRIFDPFFTTKSKDEGTGLGLSVVYGIVKSHDGAITVYSEPEKGTSFSVYLPRIIYAETREVDTDKPIIGGKERILFVDDETPLVKLGTRMLSSLGYEVTGITSSEEALDMFLAEPQSFDLVITDMTLPKMTGIDLSREILKIRPDIPIIICSGFREPSTEEQVKSLGIRAYCMKPLTKKELSRVVRETLDGEGKPIP